jgi:hypothetical protein
VFPDFSLPKAQAWWAEHVAEFAKLGPDGAWLDMNDPSTGPVDCNAMLFQEGRAPHDAYHNQYASLMAEATRRGFLKARPDKRPFLISRSGFTGGQRHSAHWTGDNWSNYHHLHTSIGKTLNLALSGMPFNGPDVPGFGGNAGTALFLDWYKAGFLFPFLRNHSMRTFKRQEPWVFPKEAFAIVRRYVRLRYKLLPYLYNLFIKHEDEGEAIMRPLFYDFEDTRRLPLAHVNDQFMVGPAIMQAPFTVEGLAEREVILPAARWWRADKPGWVAGPARFQARRSDHPHAGRRPQGQPQGSEGHRALARPPARFPRPGRNGLRLRRRRDLRLPRRGAYRLPPERRGTPRGGTPGGPCRKPRLRPPTYHAGYPGAVRAIGIPRPRRENPPPAAGTLAKRYLGGSHGLYGVAAGLIAVA